MSGGAVRLRELTLAGFGVYRKPTRFQFPDGNAVYFGANETGKSTLIHGLAAVWFGLPANSDPSKLGSARFRSFGGRDPFFGEVVWERDGRSFRLHRDLETHQVRLTEETGGRVEMLVAGEHNPLGRSSAGSAFLPVLNDLLGFSSWEIFLDTFCLAQPLPDSERLGSEVQHLLSGSQDARIDEVRARLFERIKALTLATGELGLTRPGGIRPTNQREPGLLETLEDRAAALRHDLEQGRIQLERLNDGNEAIETAQAEQREVALRRSNRRRRLAVMDSWRSKQTERTRRAEAVQLLRNVVQALHETSRERDELARRVAETAPELASAPVDLPARLERLERSTQEQERRRAESEARARDRDALQQEHDRITARLEQELADVRGRTDWAEAHHRLQRAQSRRATLEQELTEMRARRQAAALPLAEPMSVDACRTRAAHYLQAISRLEAIEHRAAEIQSQLEERAYLRDQRRLDLLEEKFALETQLKATSASLREKRARIEALVEGTGSGTRRLDAPTTDSGGSPVLWIGTLGTAALAVGLGLGLGMTVPLTILIALGGAAVFFAVHRLRKRHPASPAATVPVPVPVPEPVAGNLDLETHAPTEAEREAIAQLRATERQLELRLQKISVDVGPYATTTASELARMEGRWQALDDEIATLAAELKALCPRLAIPESAHRQWRDAELPPEMVPLLELPGAPPHPVHGSLVDWLRSLESADWERFAAQEEERRDSAREWTSLEDRIAARERELVDHEEIEALAAKLQPFTLADDPVELDRRAREAAGLERELALVDARLAALVAPEQTEDGLAGAWSDLVATWPAARSSAPFDPTVVTDPSTPLGPLVDWAAGLREQLRVAGPLQSRLDAVSESQTKILRTENCETQIELEQRLASEESALGVVVRELAALENEEILIGALRTEGANEVDAILARERSEDSADQE
ncbi:MAG: AAA family ATPase, partial [Candidatus Eisenbacteria bacterium]